MEHTITQSLCSTKKEVNHQKLISDFQVSITKKLDDALPSSGKENINPGNGSIRSHTGTRGNIFYWGGKWKRAPENFIFPLDMGLASAWDKYFNGEPRHKIGPFRNFQASDLNLKLNKYGRDRIHSYKRLILFMIKECKSRNFWFTDPTEEQIESMYKKSSPKVFSLCKSARAEAFKWNTLSRKVYAALKKK